MSAQIKGAPLPAIAETHSSTTRQRQRDGEGNTEQSKRMSIYSVPGDLAGSILGASRGRRMSSNTKGILSEGRRLSMKPVTVINTTPEEVRLQSESCEIMKMDSFSF